MAALLAHAARTCNMSSAGSMCSTWQPCHLQGCEEPLKAACNPLQPPLSVCALSALCSLTAKPQDGDMLVVDMTITSLPGNVVNITDLVTINPSRHIFSPDNWTLEPNMLVSVKGGRSPPAVLWAPSVGLICLLPSMGIMAAEAGCGAAVRLLQVLLTC